MFKVLRESVGLGIVVLCALSAASCAGAFGSDSDDDDGGIESIDEALIDGTPTLERPEIGRISGCTATLIRPNIVITAAHCVGYASRESAGNYGRFTVDAPLDGGQSRSYTIERMRSWSNGNLGKLDVTLLRLADSVPSSVAIPTDIATRSAETGEKATLYGYGCTNRRTQGGSWTKRKLEIIYNSSNNLCPGDSGGPGVLGTDGPVFLINSGYYHSGGDIFGEPWDFRDQLIEQIDTWDTNYGGGTAREEVRVTNATGAPLWVRCDGQVAWNCTDWSYVDDGSAIAIATPNRKLMLDNQDWLPDATMNQLAVTAPSNDVTVYANPSNPWSEELVPGDPNDPPINADPDEVGGRCDCDADCARVDDYKPICVQGMCAIVGAGKSCSGGTREQCPDGFRCWSGHGLPICYSDCDAFNCDGTCDAGGSCVRSPGMNCYDACGTVCDVEGRPNPPEPGDNTAPPPGNNAAPAPGGAPAPEAAPAPPGNAEAGAAGSTCDCDDDCGDVSGQQGICVRGICGVEGTSNCAGGSREQCPDGFRCWGGTGTPVCYADCGGSTTCNGTCDSDNSCIQSSGMDCYQGCGTVCTLQGLPTALIK